MAHWFERRALRRMLQPGEQVISSEVIGRFEAFAEDGSHDRGVYLELAGRAGVRQAEVVVVTEQALYVVGYRGGKIRVPLSKITGVGRRGPILRLLFDDGCQWLLTYDRRDKTQQTADDITEIFFGEVRKDTL